MSIPCHSGSEKRRASGGRAEALNGLAHSTLKQQADTMPLSVWGSEISLEQPSPDILVIKQIGFQFIGAGFLVIGSLFLYVLFERTHHLGAPWLVAMVAIIIGLLVLGRKQTIRFDRAIKKMVYGYKTIPMDDIASVQLLDAHISEKGKKYHQINLILLGTPPRRGSTLRSNRIIRARS